MTLLGLRKSRSLRRRNKRSDSDSEQTASSEESVKVNEDSKDKV